MADDADWFKPNRPPSPPRQPKPGERIWSLRKNGKQVDCELRFHGESYGWECQCLHPCHNQVTRQRPDHNQGSQR